MANEITGVGRIPVSCMSYTNELYNLAQNRMEEQTPSPQIKDEVARRAKRAIFPSLIWGKGGGGVYIFFIYFVEDYRFCEQYYLDKLLKGWRKSWQPNILLFKGALFLANGCTWLNYFSVLTWLISYVRKGNCKLYPWIKYIVVDRKPIYTPDWRKPLNGTCSFGKNTTSLCTYLFDTYHDLCSRPFIWHQAEVVYGGEE